MNTEQKKILASIKKDQAQYGSRIADLAKEFVDLELKSLGVSVGDKIRTCFGPAKITRTVFDVSRGLLEVHCAILSGHVTRYAITYNVYKGTNPIIKLV